MQSDEKVNFLGDSRVTIVQCTERKPVGSTTERQGRMVREAAPVRRCREID